LQNELLTFELVVSDEQLTSEADMVKVNVLVEQHAGGQNLALGKPVTGGSSDWGTLFSNVVDGLWDEPQLGWSADAVPNWVQIDLEDDYLISRIIIGPYMRSSASVWNYNEAWIIKYKSSADAEWQDFGNVDKLSGAGTLQIPGINITNGNPGHQNSDHAYKDYCFIFEPIKARYIRYEVIVGDSGIDANVNEIEVYGKVAPVANAGVDQTVTEGAKVTLSGNDSLEPAGSIVAYAWEQIDGPTVQIYNSGAKTATFTAPNVGIAGETLTFRLTVTDDGDLTDADTCTVGVTKDTVVDSDGDGVPDEQDDFPYDADEYVDTDGDGEGNNADSDDDNDGMPDEWELTYGLNPLEDDAGGDPDGDEVSNINEFNLGTAPNHSEGNFKPETPVLLSPENGASVTLTPLLETGDFDDPNVNDEHSKTQWVITRAFDDVCVFDVTTDASLTTLDMPKQVLEEDTEYLWKARFIDNHDTPSEWSEEREFVSGFADHDSDKNGVPDVQEVDETVDLDEDGTVDIVQTDIKCVSFQEGNKKAHICISIKGAENAESIVSMEVQDPADPKLNSAISGKPNYFEFGLLDFKILVDEPGDETTVTIFLSKSAFEKGNCFKYDPVNKTWLDYSGYTVFSPNRKIVFLTLKDGGFGDADGIENGIIVDPLAFGSETDPSGGGSDSPVEKVVDGILPDELSCFISAAAPRLQNRQSPGFWQDFRGCGLSILFAAMVLGSLVGVIIQNRKSKIV